MDGKAKLALIWLLPLAISGCAGGKKVDDDGAIPRPLTPVARYEDWRFDGPEGRGFPYYLAEGYRTFAKHEDNENDFEEAAKFLDRAAASERGAPVDPEPISHRILPAYAVDDLVAAREWLMWALGKGASSKLPKLAAQAQVMFDCWMEQQEENIQPHDIAACRRGFEDAMTQIDEALRPKPVEVTPLPPVPCVPEPVKCAIQSCAECPSSFIVYFDFDKSSLTEEARETIKRVVMQVKEMRPARVYVTGHTDRAGSLSYNETLSKNRRDTVLTALAQAGVPEDLLTTSYFGETRPWVATPDGERNKMNRRVEIGLQWK